MKIVSKARAAIVIGAIATMLAVAALATDQPGEKAVTLACEFPEVDKPYVGHIQHIKSTYRICSTCDAPFAGTKWKIYKSMLYYAVAKNGSMSIEIQQSDGKAVMKVYNGQGKLAVESHGQCNKVN